MCCGGDVMCVVVVRHCVLGWCLVGVSHCVLWG